MKKNKKFTLSFLQYLVASLVLFSNTIWAYAINNDELLVNDVRAIFVGHSLINYNMPHILEQLVQDAENLTIESAVQVVNGAPLRYNWDNCHTACDAIEAGTGDGAYNTLIVTDANNSIRSNHVWNHPERHINNFLELMKDKDAQARAFFFTSWEGLDYHPGEWTDAIPAELAEYEEIIEQATQISADLGRNAQFELIPANLALRELILKIENGQINGLSNRTDIFADDVHMNNIGNYFMANVVFSAIYKQSPAGLTNQVSANKYTPLIIETSLALQLQQLAWTVVNDYSTDESTTDNEAPDAVITLPTQAQIIEVGDSLTFSAVASDPDGDTSLTYLWDFDGITQPQTSLISSSIVFDQVGSFNISFLVIDSLGLSDPTPATIQIIVKDRIGDNTDTTPNGEPKLVITADARLDNNGIALSWDYTHPDIQYFQIYKGEVRIGHTNADGQGYNAYWLQLEVDHSFQVKAVDVNGDIIAESNILTMQVGDNSDGGGTEPNLTDSDGDGVGDNSDTFPNDASETVDSDADGIGDNADTTPNGESKFVITADAKLDNNGIALSWDYTHPDIQYFQIFKEGGFIGHTNADGQGYNKYWLQLEVDHSFQVKAVDVNGDIIAESNVLTMQVGDNEPKLVITADARLDNNGIALSWDYTHPDIQYFKIFKDGAGISHTNADGQGYNQYWLQRGVDYSFQIKAVNVNGDIIAESNVLTMQVGDNSDGGGTEPKLVITADARLDNNGIALSWDYTYPGIQYFKIFKDGGGIGHTNADGQGYNKYWLQQDVDHSFQVKAVDVNGDIIAESNVLTVQVGDNSDEEETEPNLTDSDGDGVIDIDDVFPLDPTETVDSDGDGVGDNSDAFPNDANETLDSDGDGIGDNSDATPNGEPNDDLTPNVKLSQISFVNSEQREAGLYLYWGSANAINFRILLMDGNRQPIQIITTEANHTFTDLSIFDNRSTLMVEGFDSLGNSVFSDIRNVGDLL